VSYFLGREFTDTLVRMQKAIMQILKVGVLYFALVFGAGFVLGAIRTLWVVPRVGTRKGELMEMPIMLVVTIVAARWIVLHFAISSEALVRRSRQHRAWLDAGRGIRPRALGSRLVDKTVLRDPRSCVGNGLLRDAWLVCGYAAPCGQKMSPT
jgi:hypothetical protein